MIKDKTNNQGFSIFEILIAVFIIGLVFSGLAALSNLSLRLSQQAKNSLIANNLAAEMIEAARAVKEESWPTISGLIPGNAYYPEKIGSPLKWSLAPGSQNLNGFTRQIVFNLVYRDAAANITSSGGVLDPNTKKVTATVAWTQNGRSYNAVISTYLTNWK